MHGEIRSRWTPRWVSTYFVFTIERRPTEAVTHWSQTPLSLQSASWYTGTRNLATRMISWEAYLILSKNCSIFHRQPRQQALPQATTPGAFHPPNLRTIIRDITRLKRLFTKALYPRRLICSFLIMGTTLTLQTYRPTRFWYYEHHRRTSIRQARIPCLLEKVPPSRQQRYALPIQEWRRSHFRKMVRTIGQGAQ